MDQLQSMRVFVRVVETGNFTRAADSLGLPKATVTKQIQALETRLHTRLLNRTTRRVSVTPDGAAYYERTARLLGDFDDIESSMINAQAAPGGRLRIDVSPAIARFVVMPKLSGFMARFPDIRLDIGVSEGRADLLGDNIDVVLRAGKIGDLSLVARRIGLLRFITVASPAYLARHGEPAHPSDLEKRRHVVVSFFRNGGIRRHHPLLFERGAEHIEINTESIVAVNESNAHVMALLSGYGVSQTTTSIAANHLERGELIPVLTQWSRPPVPIFVVYPPNRHLSAKVRVFVDWIAEVFAADPLLRIGDPLAPVGALPTVTASLRPDGIDGSGAGDVETDFATAAIPVAATLGDRAVTESDRRHHDHLVHPGA